MAGRRRTRSSKNEAGGGLLVFIVYSIYTFWVENKEAIVFVTVLCCCFLAVILVVWIYRNRKYWNWYYSRERGLEEIGKTELLDEEETDNILNMIGKVIKGCNKEWYKAFKNDIDEAFGSEDIAYVEGNALVETYKEYQYSTDSFLRYLNVSAEGDIFCIYLKANKDGGYYFLILPGYIYIFIVGVKAVTFVGAYDKKIMKLKLEYVDYRKEYHHINDMSHKPHGYFLRYCDIHDSKAVRAGWQYETKDGYRDGRRQSNNFFMVDFRYTKIEFSFGDFYSTVAFSKTDCRDNLKKSYKDYCSGKLPPEVMNNVNVETSSGLKVDSTDSNNVENKTFVLTTSSARERNRYIAKSVRDLLNGRYSGVMEFRTFQVRKERDTWKLQDTSIYTYWPFEGASICVEFILRTSIEERKTCLEYRISSEEWFILEKYGKPLFEKYRMSQEGSPYYSIVDELNDWEKDDVITYLNNRIQSLIDEMTKVFQRV